MKRREFRPREQTTQIDGGGRKFRLWLTKENVALGHHGGANLFAAAVGPSNLVNVGGSFDLGPTAAANKLAMSRALGAAFLNHQVEQLEKTVVSNGPASGNWRDRKQPHLATPPQKRGANSPNKANNRRRGGDISKERDAGPRGSKNLDSAPPKRRFPGEEKHEKDADVVIVDASVLVHALDNLKKWCRNGREEVVIVPLEANTLPALNTLDLLKKGSTALAQRSRAASRILEAQVGTNPRIRVQQDDAFVPWDKISFKDGTLSEDSVTEHSPHVSPEWSLLPSALRLHSLSPQLVPVKLSESPTESALTPVPLPAPTQHSYNKHEPRSSGSLVAHWAARAGLQVIDVKPTAAPAPSGNARSSSEEERPKRIAVNKGRRGPANGGAIDSSKGGMVERSPAVLAMMEMVSQPSKVVRVLARGEKLEPDP
ncbi:hypothetical protein EV421DRAFT_1743341 [Armillaria borealis]|uniref:PIN domain-containing protein n=1 Tax=Armillaria borealis TaxID=47425 RepID=A0AA39IVF5_9AGAR|nr:hypothetical protein EV421DRAFT_1743341 [Armillaria borealis]